MRNSKNTKRALLTSVLSMLLCVAMLVGSTFAWFTDSVTSGKNKIVAGNLDVELYHTNGAASEEKVEADTKLFVNSDGSDILWEPGVMVYENFTVKNVGTLALKYSLTVNADKFNTVAGTEKSLKDVLKVAILDEAFSGDRAAAQALTFDKTIADFAKEGNIEAQAADDTYAIVVYWEPSDVDNDYNLNNGKTSSDGEPLFIDLGVNLVATQDTVENDSFDNQYDKDAANELKTGASVKGIAGFENTVFGSIQEAYDAISPLVAELGGLEQNPPVGANRDEQNANFNALFNDDGNITWTIYGEQTVDNSYIFSFGRKASHYNDDSNIKSINIVGGNDSANLIMNTSVVLPYNWWSETQPTVSSTISDLTITQGTANNISISPSNGFKFDLAFKNCDINGFMYCYWNGDFSLTFDGCNFKKIKTANYCLHIQGNDNGQAEPKVTFVNNTVDGFGRGINLDCLNTEFTVTNNTFKSSTVTYKGVIQITRGKKFTVNGNTFESGVKGYAIDLHDLLANADVDISNNTVNSSKFILNQITAANKDSVNITQTDNSGTAIPQA